MPEGDTVWLAGRRMNNALAGGALVRGELRVPAHATSDLAGRTVLEVRSRGKHLLTRLSGRITLHTHFRMDGSWHLYPAGESWRGGPEWQVRAVLQTPTWQAVGYRLPVVSLLPTDHESHVVGHLGPDLLGEDWNPLEAARRLSSDPSREIGEVLLDQRVMAGLGNIYRTEVCFLVGVTPWTPIRDVDDVDRVVLLARRLLVANRERPRQVTTGLAGRGARHWVFERGQCLRCGSRVARSRQGAATRERITYWCPECQTGPAPWPTAPGGGTSNGAARGPR